MACGCPFKISKIWWLSNLPWTFLIGFEFNTLSGLIISSSSISLSVISLGAFFLNNSTAYSMWSSFSSTTFSTWSSKWPMFWRDVNKKRTYGHLSRSVWIISLKLAGSFLDVVSALSKISNTSLSLKKLTSLSSTILSSELVYGCWSLSFLLTISSSRVSIMLAWSRFLKESMIMPSLMCCLSSR